MSIAEQNRKGFQELLSALKMNLLTIPRTRESALALTKLDEAGLWANEIALENWAVDAGEDNAKG